MKTTCPACNGSGYGIAPNFETRQCDTCNGSGSVVLAPRLVYPDEPWSGNLADPCRHLDLNLKLQPAK